MRVLVTGATGLIGSAVAAELHRRGHAIDALVRTPDAASRATASGWRSTHGDLGDPASLAAAARDADAVVHCAFAMNRSDMADGARLDTQAAQAFLTALAGSGRPFLYTSGSLVLGDTGEDLFDEAHDPRDPPAFVAWRLAIERRVREQQGLRGVVVRPALVYGGAGNAMLNWMRQDALGRGAAIAIGGGANAWSSVHTEDLANLYALALEKAAAGAVWHGAAGSPVALLDIARAISRSAGLGGRIVDVPLAEATAALPFAAAIAMNSRLSSDRTQAALGWQPRRPALLETLELRRS